MSDPKAVLEGERAQILFRPGPHVRDHFSRRKRCKRAALPQRTSARVAEQKARRTDEGDPGVWWALAQYLGYLGVQIGAEELRGQYQSRIDFQISSSPHEHPEVDVFAVFRDIFAAYGKMKVSREKIITAAMLFRSLSRRQFGLFPEAAAVLKRLRARHAVALVSDAQWVFTEPELEITGLRDLFEARVLSSRLGFKKPDPRLFAKALAAIRVPPGGAVYVGDNPSRDLEALEFHRLGLGDPFRISALHGHGTGDLLDEIVDRLPGHGERPVGEEAIRVAILGRPNVKEEGSYQ